MYSWKAVLPNGLRLLLIENRYYFNEKKKNHKKHLMELFKKNQDYSLPIETPMQWIKKFEKLTYAYPDLIEVGEAFCESQITIIKNQEVLKDDVIAICVEKNDLHKIKTFISYHRSLGVDKFVVLDNGSDDGSLQWLMKQDDVILMQTTIPYTTNRREGWINRIMAFYGQNRWYLILDSDELLTYHECEKKSIHDLISYLENGGKKRARALMIDMYAESEYYENGRIEDYMSECIYFDTSSYYLNKRYFMDLVCGGPRERVFHQAPWLTKYPLIYLGKNDIECKSHFLFPFKDNLNTKCLMALRHYKFQPGEISRMRKIVKDGNYFNGSAQYKRYLEVIEKNNKLDFMYEGSKKYVTSESLSDVNLYDPIIWREE